MVIVGEIAFNEDRRIALVGLAFGRKGYLRVGVIVGLAGDGVGEAVASSDLLANEDLSPFFINAGIGEVDSACRTGLLVLGGVTARRYSRVIEINYLIGTYGAGGDLLKLRIIGGVLI